MSEQNKQPDATPEKTPDENRPFADVQPLKERLYDQIKIPVKVLDAIIALLIIALIACLVIGTIKGNAI